MRSPSNNPSEENNPTLENHDGYRLLTVESVMQFGQGDFIEVKFKDLLRVMNIRIELLKQAEIKSLKTGDRIFIKGKSGNLDHQLYDSDKITDIKSASKENVKSVLNLVK